ncbi:SRPBCC domain-containing protein [Sphingobacterium sp. UBA5670]|uniref:SRPBCC domain-containing protein n=1 Tax=Sphingobacterium sp. UBA5670 TaxID=1947502 RepID=UPI0025CCF784|nr:SRPBCC domain-containing protein [Sphingobacterium sp. UBA5670]
MNHKDQPVEKLVSVILVEKQLTDVWTYWNDSDAIMQWNIPFDDWHCPAVSIDFREGGMFNFRMEQIGNREGFDYMGVFDEIIPMEYIESTSGGRKCIVEFQAIDNNTIIRETFEPDAFTPVELQQSFTDGVLLNFKKFMENKTY